MRAATVTIPDERNIKFTDGFMAGWRRKFPVIRTGGVNGFASFLDYKCAMTADGRNNRALRPFEGYTATPLPQVYGEAVAGLAAERCIMADLPASDELAASAHHGPAWGRRLRAALPCLLYAALVLAVFGGIAVDHLPESPTARLGLVGGGAALLLLAALWLDRREGRHTTTERDPDAKREALGAGD